MKEIISENPKIELYCGDCLEVLKEFPNNSIDAIVTDPPAGIGFMGKEWDNFGKGLSARDKFVVWLEKVAKECLRVIKPGGHSLVWALPRTSHWTATAWENAGWEVRDRIIYCFGSGFPKSLNIGKKLKMKEYEGIGTALKPAVEDWWLLRKPLEKGLNVAENVLKWGVGGLNIDECRIQLQNGENLSIHRETKKLDTRNQGWGFKAVSRGNEGRFPSHLIHDGSEEVVELFPMTKGGKFREGIARKRKGHKLQESYGKANAPDNYGDSGSASRFFYCAKASRRERDMGLDGLPLQVGGGMKGTEDKSLLTGSGNERNNLVRNNHPTVKPVNLMKYLVKLITPPKGVVLDCFMGSGSTGIACAIMGYNFIGIEIDKEYYEIAKKRIEYHLKQETLALFTM